MFTAKAFAASSSTSPLAAASIPRRDTGPDDVELEILFCGVCHSDLHTARNEWAVWPTVYPCVPGHEIVGRVTKVGRQCHQLQGGRPGGRRLHGRSRAGRARSCKEGLEQYCDTGGTVFTYNSPDPARDGAGHLRRLLRRDRRERALRPAGLAEAGSGRGIAAAVRRHHALFAAASTGARGPARRWASSASAGSGTWASSSRTRSARTRCCSRRRRRRSRTASASGPTKS